MDAQQAQAAPAPPPAPAPAAAPAGDVDITGELTKLAELRNNGILTDEEFAAAKAKLLAQTSDNRARTGRTAPYGAFDERSFRRTVP